MLLRVPASLITNDIARRFETVERFENTVVFPIVLLTLLSTGVALAVAPLE